MKVEKIECPECVRKGKRSWLASIEDSHGVGYLRLWCKRCKKEVRISIADLSRRFGNE